jgi:hypothetical protein
VHLELEPEAPNLSLTPTFLRGCSLPLFGTHIIFACPISCLADLELPPVLHFGSGGRETESKRWGPTLGHASLLAKPSIEIDHQLSTVRRKPLPRSLGLWTEALDRQPEALGVIRHDEVHCLVGDEIFEDERWREAARSGGSPRFHTGLRHSDQRDEKRGQSDRCECQEGRAVTS